MATENTRSLIIVRIGFSDRTRWEIASAGSGAKVAGPSLDGPGDEHGREGV
jgi:hypothetical protein